MNIETAKPSETYEGLRRQFMALRTLAASTEQIASGLRRELKDQTQSLAELAAERATNEQLTATLMATEAERDRLKAENEALRSALAAVINHVEGNTECLVRDLVNWGTPKVDANEFYDECGQIKAIAHAALDSATAKAVSHD